MEIDYKDICLKVAGLAQNAGRALKTARAKEAPQKESKGRNDFVTRFDKQTEERLIRELSELLPQSGFVAEENSSDKGSYLQLDHRPYRRNDKLYPRTIPICHKYCIAGK